MLVDVLAVVRDAARCDYRITHQLKTDFPAQHVRNVTLLQHTVSRLYVQPTRSLGFMYSPHGLSALCTADKIADTNHFLSQVLGETWGTYTAAHVLLHHTVSRLYVQPTRLLIPTIS